MIQTLNRATQATLSRPGILHILLAAPGILLVGLALIGQLGIEPLEELLEKSGVVAIWIFTLSLCISPLAKIFPKFELARLLKRKARAVGLAVYGYATAHLLFHILYEGGLGWIAESGDKPFIYLGIAAWLGLGILAITSWSFFKRKFGGKRWKLLHRSAYLIAAVALIHFAMAGKGHWAEAPIYAGIVVTLRMLAWKTHAVRKAALGAEHA